MKKFKAKRRIYAFALALVLAFTSVGAGAVPAFADAKSIVIASNMLSHFFMVLSP